jgi:hypothetical protein
MSKPLNWYFRRHPILYKIRFQLASKKASIKTIESFCYNDINKKNNIPKLFFEINNLIFSDENKALSDLDKAIKISIWLKNNIKGGPGLGKSSTTALIKMMQGEGGVCSDISQIFSNFCVINDIKVKEWGMKSLSSDPRISGGHSFNEIYCNTFQKWIMIDAAKSILLYDSDKKIPLSAVEYIKFKAENKKIIIASTLSKEDVNDANAYQIYLLSNSSPFVITNYNNKTYDYLLDRLDFLPVSIIHGILFLIGKGYKFEFPKEN